jgi:hypothetical protein
MLHSFALFTLWLSNLFNVLFNLLSGQHHLMSAAEALEAKIHANAKYFPFKAAARVLFFKLYDITDI